jgi:hypothetical protein
MGQDHPAQQPQDHAELTVSIWYILNNAYAIAAQLGLLWGIVLFARALLVLRTGIPLFTPVDYVNEQVAAHPIGPDGIGPDYGWPLYTYRQASIDVARVRTTVKRLNAGMWRWPSDTFFRGRHGPRWAWWIFLFPVCVSVLLFVSGAFGTSWFSYWVYWAVVFAFRFTDKTVIASVRGWMRTREERRRVTMHTDAACMNCLHVTPWPAYACPDPSCGRLHHDVRPGNLGTFTRNCECGAKFPTLPSRAAWHATAVCKRCRQPLPEGAGAVRDVRVPIFGDTSAGKTRFLYASLNSLLLSGIQVSYLDESSESNAGLGLRLIREGGDTLKTSEGNAAAISLRLNKGHACDLIHLFDAAGEQYSQVRNYDDLRFLEDGQGLVYVLDPFSIEGVRNQLTDGHRLAAAQPAQRSPELVYSEVVNRLRGAGVPIRAQRLAVVLSKADLLREGGLDIPSDSEGIAQWLEGYGQHNIVMATRREFAEVQFFTVASLDVAASRADDPGIPLCWLLAAHGVKLPGGRTSASQQGRPVEAHS